MVREISLIGMKPCISSCAVPGLLCALPGHPACAVHAPQKGFRSHLETHSEMYPCISHPSYHATKQTFPSRCMCMIALCVVLLIIPSARGSCILALLACNALCMLQWPARMPTRLWPCRSYLSGSQAKKRRHHHPPVYYCLWNSYNCWSQHIGILLGRAYPHN